MALKTRFGRWAFCLLLLLPVAGLLSCAAVLQGPERAEEGRLDAFPAALAAADLRALRKAYAAGPAHWPAPVLAEGANFRELAPLEIRSRPEGRDAERAALGADLFNDPALSRSGQIACQNCHNRSLGWGDGLPRSFGHDRTEGRRNAPPLFNAAYRKSLFWDGRAPDLVSQAVGPLTNPAEMANHDLASVAGRLNGSGKYGPRFRSVYGRDEAEPGDILDALAAFEATLEQPTRFDRFMRGDTRMLSDRQIWGLHLFRTKAGCINCHNGPLLTDEGFHNIGLSFIGRRFEDLGRYEATGAVADAGRFRTPSLRHVRRTGPYMHNGLMPTLEGIVNLYAVGGGRTRPRSPEQAAEPVFQAATRNADLLKTFKLTTDERAALVAFLEAL